MTVNERRPMGSLEADVLRYLWNASEPATPGEVHEGATISASTSRSLR